MKKLPAASAALFVLLSPPVWAASSIVTPTPSFTANDLLTGSGFFGSSISVQAGVLAGFDGLSLQSYHLGTQSLLSSIPLPNGNPYFASAFNSFVRIDPSGTSAWLGFSVGGNTDDRIFQVDFALQTWTQKATLKGNSDLRFFGGNAYVSGLEGNSPSISLLDTSGANNHDVVLTLSGNSAGFDFDSTGNLYYATNTFPATTAALVKFTSGQVASGIGAGSIAIGAATLLAELGGGSTGAYNVAVDSADHVFIAENAGFNGLRVSVWNGTAGTGQNYITLAAGNNFLTVADTDGDVLAGTGALYQSGFGGPGVAEIKTVPEPSSGMLLAAGLLLFGRSRRRR